MEIIQAIYPQPNPLVEKGKGWTWTSRHLIRAGVNNALARPESDYTANLRLVTENTVPHYYHLLDKWNDRKDPRWSFGPVLAQVEFPHDACETRSALKLQNWFDKINEQIDISTMLGELPMAVSHVHKTATDFVHALIALRKGRISKAFSLLGITSRRKAKVAFYDQNSKKKIVRTMTGKQHKRQMSAEWHLVNRKHRKQYLKGRYQVKNSKFVHPDFINFGAEKWLELQYGWYPLMMDTEAVMRLAMESVIAVPKPEISKRISTVLPVKISQESPQGTSTVSGTYRLGYDLVLQMDDPVAVADYAFGVASVVPALWEFIPGSFIVDWFIPIGNWLESISVPTGFRLKRCTKTTKLDYSLKTTGHPYDGNYAADVFYYDGNYTEEVIKYFSRTANSTPPEMTLAGVLAHASDGISNDIDHAVTAIALLKTIFLNKG